LKKRKNKCDFGGLLAMLTSGALVPEVEFPDAEEVMSERENYREYLSRAQGEILKTLAREVKPKYQPPKGILKVIFSAALRASERQSENTAIFSECVKSVKAYLLKIGRDYLENGSREAEQELNSIFRDYVGIFGVSVKKYPRISVYEGNRGKGVLIRLGTDYVEGMDGETEICLSVYGLRRTASFGFVDGTVKMRVFDMRCLAPLAIWSQLKMLMGTGQRQGILLSECLTEDTIRMLGSLHRESEEKEIYFDTFHVEGTFDSEKFCRTVSTASLRVTANSKCRFVYYLRGRITPWLITGDTPSMKDAAFMSKSLSLSEMHELGKLVSVYLMDELAEKSIEHYSHELGHTARVFETLKNHTWKSLKAMAGSPFNRYFGFVEIDDGVETGEFNGKYFEDFAAVLTEYFPDWKGKGMALRVRKLGRHHAAGIYFPGIDCVCVDWNHPESTMHEIGHRYDYDHGELSRKAAFLPIQKEYGDLLRKASKEDSVKNCLKGKYDLGYYLLPTEIFARCLEMYLTRICRVENSVVKAESVKKFAYPDSEKLNRLIGEYFDAELGTRREKETLIAAAEAV